jgi:glucosamine--fructose-6-phosphate aminotransferase (isomerizing)
MCGIIGIISSNDVSARLVEGLKRLEYRGYDSAGIAVITENRILDRRRAEGKLVNLANRLEAEPLTGTIGIGHTRWATHGRVVEANAHPMADDIVAVVHNGIIENFAALREELTQRGCVFTSHTDTEVVMHVVSENLRKGLDPLSAVRETLARIKGAFALVFLFKDHDDLLIATRKGSPMVLGIADNELFVGSDAIALASLATSLIYLDDGDTAVLQRKETPVVTIYNSDGTEVTRAVRQTSISNNAISKGDYTHYMLKEIYEQPLTISDTLQSLISVEDGTYHDALKAVDANFSRIRILACGTSYYAGLVAKYWFEKWAGIPVDVEIASEFRYRSPVFTGDTLNIFITQSGETIDTLSALMLAVEHKEATLAIVNVAESSIARSADFVLQTMAGPEIGVASTKAFTAQLAVLAALCLKFGSDRGALQAEAYNEIMQSLVTLPGLVSDVLRNDGVYQQVAISLSQAQHALFLGRGLNYPIAMEGALKLKEISYIHAEGYPAGELKHGPIALIDTVMPVIVIAPDDEWFDKTLSNLQEVLARGAKVIVFTTEIGAEKITRQTQGLPCLHVVTLPLVHNFIAPLLYTIPIQLLAYYTAHMKGTDVDQPRNLAKSVTVE